MTGLRLPVWYLSWAGWWWLFGVCVSKLSGSLSWNTDDMSSFPVWFWLWSGYATETSYGTISKGQLIYQNRDILDSSLQGVYIASVLSPLPITAAKFSVLYLYHRLFSSDKRLRTRVIVVGVFCLLWFIAATVAVSLKCMPIEKSWNPRMAGTCYNFQVFIVAIECPNSFLDFVIVALPVGVIRGLHLPLSRKVLICLIFILGGL